MAVADVSVQFCQIWSDVIRCSPMWSDAVISHTELSEPITLNQPKPDPKCLRRKRTGKIPVFALRFVTADAHLYPNFSRKITQFPSFHYLTCATNSVGPSQ